jgi:geranylgeranyl diphosphate synthase, type II
MKNIKKYQNLINNYIKDSYLPSIKNKKLRDIISYSLDKGKRLRSMIVLDISYSISGKYLFDMAMSVEILHTASLILDDLPCMDNDDLRRNKPSIHKKYGEKTAKIVAYFLLFESYNLINKYNNLDQYNSFNNIFQELCKQNSLASYGQFFDLNHNGLLKKCIKKDDINLKTSPFFSVAFIGGYLLAGGEYKNINLIKKCALYFSNFFQIYDDFNDEIEDQEGTNINQVILFGKKKALEIFNRDIGLFNNITKTLNLNTELFSEIIEYLKNKITI